MKNNNGKINTNKIKKHNIPPIFSKDSKILILGSFPSVISRDREFYYANPKNRFWSVLGAVFNDMVPEDTEGKKMFLQKHKIALWDVVACCEIESSKDSSIKNITPNNIEYVLNNSSVEKIFTNGKTADKLYDKFFKDKIKLFKQNLPSTSPANASYRLENLILIWKEKINKEKNGKK